MNKDDLYEKIRQTNNVRYRAAIQYQLIRKWEIEIDEINKRTCITLTFEERALMLVTIGNVWINM